MEEGQESEYDLPSLTEKQLKKHNDLIQEINRRIRLSLDGMRTEKSRWQQRQIARLREETMKSFEQSFREFLTEAELGQYVDGGQITLFHYTKHPEDSLVLDPNYKKSAYSKREFEVAQTPRVFFYTDPKQRETFFRAGVPLFTTKVDASRIYDFKNDPEGYIEKNRHPVYGLRKGEEWNTLLEDIREDYDGIFYSTNRFDVVAWFQPIEVNKVSQEEQARLEGE
jgi:hypothetical protein